MSFVFKQLKCYFTEFDSFRGALPIPTVHSRHKIQNSLVSNVLLTCRRRPNQWRRHYGSTALGVLDDTHIALLNRPMDCLRSEERLKNEGFVIAVSPTLAEQTCWESYEFYSFFPDWLRLLNVTPVLVSLVTREVANALVLPKWRFAAFPISFCYNS